MIVEWHPDAVEDVAAFGTDDQRRIQNAVADLASLDDPRQRLVPYAASLKGYWKLRVGDYRLVCAVKQRRGQVVLVIYVAHRSVVYSGRSIRALKSRGEP